MQRELGFYKDKIRSILIKRKKSILSSLVVFFMIFIGMVFCSISCLSFSNHYESIARKMGNKTYVCEVKSKRENDTYRDFFSYADDLAGAEIKRNVDSFILCEDKDGVCPSEIIIPESSNIEINSIFQHTTWSLDTYTYNFLTLSGNPIKQIAEDEVYLTPKISSTLAEEFGCSEMDLSGMKLKIKTKTGTTDFIIVDVIINFDDLDFGPYFPKNTIITHFSSTATMFENSKYVAVLRGGYLSKNYQLKYIDGAINKMKDKGIEYVDSLFRLSNKTLHDDGIESLKVKTATFFNGGNKALVFFGLLSVVPLIVICFGAKRKKIGKEFYLSLFLSFLIYLLLTSKFIPLFVISNTIILLANSSSSVILLLYGVTAIIVYMIFVPKNSVVKENRKTIIKI